MTRTCAMAGCDRETGTADGQYRDARFCSPECDGRHAHLRADARDARLSVEGR